MQWSFGDTTRKKIAAKNVGEASSFVRISLYEYMLAFAVDTNDQTGNGNLAISDKVVKPTVDFFKTETWVEAASSGGTYQYGGINYLAKKAIVPTGVNDRYRKDSTLREGTDLRWFQFGFSQNVYTEIPKGNQGEYWLYEDGYFYYSKLLKPGETSKTLVDTVTLQAGAPNRIKGSLYKLEPVLDAHDATLALLDTWGVGNVGPVYTLYYEQLK